MAPPSEMTEPVSEQRPVWCQCLVLPESHSPAALIRVGEHRPAGQRGAMYRGLEHSQLPTLFLPVWTSDRLYPLSSHSRGVSGAWVQLGTVGLFQYRDQKTMFLNLLAAWTFLTESWWAVWELAWSWY